jgi:hypothetical protein
MTIDLKPPVEPQHRELGELVVTTRPLAVALSTEIVAHEARLLDIREEVLNHRRWMDGLLFGYFGVDSVITWVPVVGEAVTVGTTGWLLIKASQARMSGCEKLLIFTLGAADTAIGAVTGVGDLIDAVAVRSNGWNARLIAAHCQTQLAQIEAVERRIDAGTATEADVEHLRDALFHGGRTKSDRWLRLGVIGAVCTALLGYCAYQDHLSHERELVRQERVKACQARGEWFCNWQ